MKKLILTLGMALCLTTAFAQPQAGNDKNQKGGKTTKISQQSLPEKSKKTINENFPSNEVKSVKKDGNSNYKVKFDGGSSVSFDKNGDWNKVNTKSKTSVPRDMVPEKISSYVSKNHSNQKIKSIERHSDGTYKVVLASGIILAFSSLLELISNN